MGVLLFPLSLALSRQGREDKKKAPVNPLSLVGAMALS
jgi:hypothetical protein